MATPSAEDQGISAPRDMVTSNCETFVSTSAEPAISLFYLPPEIRLVVWELLLPGRRVLNVRTRNDSDPQNARLALEGQPRQPVLSQICQESRNFILGRGAFVFKNGDDGGFWWSAEDDVLLVDYHCALGPLSYALEGLDGLGMIQNVAVDSFQAVAFKWYKQEPRDAGTGTAADSEGAHTVRWLFSWGKIWDCPSYKHPIMRFFPQLRRLTVHFARPFHDTPHSELYCDLPGDCSFTFDIPAEDMEAAISSFKEFRSRWSNLPGGSDPVYRFRWRQHTVYQFSTPTSDTIEFCRKPSFDDNGDYITREWACSHRVIWKLEQNRTVRRKLSRIR